MNNPIKIFNEIRNAYLKYINSGLPFSREEYNQERNVLIKEPGTICQPPIIEIVPKYHEKATLAEFCERESVSTDLNDFVNTGLFVNNSHQERRLYDHQYAALKEAFINRKHIVVTTGTGSGKTECFLLPVIADLVTESKNWGKNRPRAMRTMILYPLNALAEDQMTRLRKALNSRNSQNTGALDWLDTNRRGHRFYFGRYTGATPVSGTKDKAKNKLYEEKKLLMEDWKAAKEAASREGNTELLYHVPCMDDDSAEMWDRFSMQENAPDILITNYSMLNVMLMREHEAHIFAETKAWLQENPSHIFHLVIDELHTYRGTAGTEVAYLLRVLLDRLGLQPNSPQVQFLASSASLEENQQSIDFLSEFFGVEKADFNKKFKILSNPKQSPVAKPNIALPISVLKEYGEADDDGIDTDKKTLKDLSCASFAEATEKYELLSWLKYALSSPKGVVAKDRVQIAESLPIDEEVALSVVAGLLKILCKSEENGNFIAPLRAHFFFRNVSGIWGCSDPNCSHIQPRYAFEGRAIGTLYKHPRNVCDCGMKVLEVLVCENCGEVYLGGYKICVDGHTYLNSEKPINGKSTEYCILWKGKADPKDGWKRVSYNPSTGEYFLDMDGEYSIFEHPTETEIKFPYKCPQCEVFYTNRNSVTPIRYHGAGFQKVNQILTDALIRSMKNAKEKNTKVVLFSDSRQAAAKLSAGIELDHFRDVLRWAILHALGKNNDIVSFLNKMRSTPLNNWGKEDGQRLNMMSKDPTYGVIANLIMPEQYGFLTEEQVKELDDFFNRCNGQSLGSIENDVFKILLKLGMNPAGPKPTFYEKETAGIWYKLYDFNKLKTKPSYELSQYQRKFCEDIEWGNKIEQLASIFSNRNRSFEGLKLGYLAPTQAITDSVMKELLCSVIRILGEKKRIKGWPSEYPDPTSFPKAVRTLVGKIYNIKGQKEITEKLNNLRDELRKWDIIDGQAVVLTGNGLSFVKAEVGAKYWICPRCKTVHMHHSNGICINCFHSLTKEYVLTEEDIKNPDDYYLTLLNSTDNVYRLHCEEMTGQTSKTDSRNRQRLFQDIFLKTENPIVEGIDLLSVTTTMEAGVDIGSLSAVVMGNVPPQRFNYQQRVGRAGRRGNPLSIALTVARSTSHDLTNFQEYERMVSDSPKDPYLEIRTKEIAERIIYKEILYSALKDNNSGSDSVHGNFGTVEQWTKKQATVSEWLWANRKEVIRIINVVTVGTEITDTQKKEIEDFIYNNLINRISEIAASNEYSQIYLSERLANAGLLPMFGFPTRTRNLYLSMPKKLPAEDVVSRDIDMALNSFAPGHEIVKDKKVYKSVGVVDYEYDKLHQIKPKRNSLNKYFQPLYRCDVCGYSSISQDNSPDRCPVCGEEMQKVTICSPLGFCVDYNIPPEDFNGSYDWYSPNSDIKLDCEQDLQNCPQVDNLTIRNNVIPTQGRVHLVNDNKGELYKLGKNNEGIYVSRDAYPDGNKLSLQSESAYAFVSTKTTGVLTLSIADIPDNLCLSPLNNENKNAFAVRSAFLSWGYLVRKSISTYLDIDSSELTVGFYITPQTKKAEVFFVEDLENGAGYCNYLSGRRYKEVPKDAIILPLIEKGTIYEMLTLPNHEKGCTSSCYDCLRDYSNQNVHPLLNWRLGLDLARLAHNSSATIDFTVDYWKTYINTVIKNMLLTHGYTVEYFNDTLVGRDPYGEKYCLVHPLWSLKYISNLMGEEIRAYNQLSVFDISAKSLY